MSPSRWAPLACLVLPVCAAAEPLLFLRVDQSGGLERGNVAASYSLEGARAVLAIEGTGDRGDAYVGVVHHLTAAYGILDWLSVGAEQSLKQPAVDQLRVGMLSPELRARFDGLGLPFEGLGAYLQARLRITAERQSSLVGGLLLERERARWSVAARLGFEGTVGTGVPEVGFRWEAGAGWALAPSWRVTAEAWGTTRWVGDAAESDYHGGPSLQFRWRALRAGVQLGAGVRSRTRMLVVDGTAMARVAVGF